MTKNSRQPEDSGTAPNDTIIVCQFFCSETAPIPLTFVSKQRVTVAPGRYLKEMAKSLLGSHLIQKILCYFYM
jgi:hypothetical protein